MTPRMARASALRGFTLIELMTTMVIIGILAAIAIPNYRGYVQRGYRTEARSVLSEAAQHLERFRSINGRYDRTSAGVAYALPAALATSPQGSAQPRYRIALRPGTLTAYAFVLQAVPVDTGTACGTLLYDQTGAWRTEPIAGAAPANARDCLG